jgi:diadenosine tetraphosphatase ApaH/serine/threonine PP2A family protein phosphatase
VPEFRDYQRRIWAGEVDLAEKDVKIVYGRVHWEQLVQNVRQPRYIEALKDIARH